jgi:hypothetical protein
MTPRKTKKKPATRVTVEVGRWTATAQPGRLALPAVRRACGDQWTAEWNGKQPACRFRVERAADVIAALQALEVPHTVNGALPPPELFT